MRAVDDIARAHDSDPDHNKKVTSLALEIFDALRPLHGYGAAERRLLEVAGRLHDIGWSRTVLKKHHKLSGQMILEMDIPGLSSRQREICSLVARYHTKALPDAGRHRRFAALSPRQQHLVEWLAAMLRVADALDSSHTGVVRKLKPVISQEALTIHLETRGECWDEIRRARLKQRLLVKKSGRPVVYQC
jgi:exopolyphosphatase/guanosine-5'-triphosphate,3'-diphosphate pyrophosphatase